ncbi:MAG: CsgG/HfaB family protein [Acidobacteriota bacterium]
MKSILSIAIAALSLTVLPASAQAPPDRSLATRSPSAPPDKTASYEISDRFTAQRRPRVTVLSFEDTNKKAQEAHYGSSVEAMLVTFLKRKSQFVVIERSEIKKLLDERQRLRLGEVKNDPGDSAGRDLLERVDVYILGKVTLLDGVQTEVKTAQKNSEQDEEAADDTTSDSEEENAGSDRAQIQGARVEVDAKLISRFDGRIIAAAQRSGPVACLRSIVERLGVALEQSYLRPYYGQLRFVLKEPEYVRVFLTPILLDTALDEEKPPIELSRTVTIGSERDVVRPWTTDSTSYKIENLLSGWYSMRLERPGYEGMGTENSRWEARDRLGNVAVIDRTTGKPVARTDPQVSRFIVKVDPLTTGLLDGDKQGFRFRKLEGSFSPTVKRQYLDKDYSRVPARVVLLGGKEVEINRIESPEEYADDQKCDLFNEEKPGPLAYGRTYVAAGEEFDISTYSGGELVIEDYKGEPVPVGKYQLQIWEPNYALQKIQHTVRDGDQGKVMRTALVRQTMAPSLDAPSPRPAAHGFLDGRDTHYRIGMPLDFSQPKEWAGIPVDSYSASTDIPGLNRWNQTIELFGGPVSPPTYDTESPDFKPGIIGGVAENSAPLVVPKVTFKTRFGLGGRLDALSSRPDALAADLFIDPDIADILDLLLANREEREEEGRGGFLALLLGRKKSPPPIDLRVALPQPPPLPGGFGPTLPTAPAQIQVTASTPCADEGLAAPRTRAKTQLPCNLEALRALLASRLESIDLLILDARDMAGLEASPETASIVARWVETGGSLYGFASEEGDYGGITGAPLAIESLGRRNRRFELAPGDVGAVLPSFEKKVKVKSRRALPDLSDLVAGGAWRVLAYTKPEEGPRIIERTSRENGGYVLLWFDDPSAFVGPLGGRVKKVEEVRRRVEERAFKGARYVMYRRFDLSGDLLRKAEDALLH